MRQDSRSPVKETGYYVSNTERLIVFFVSSVLSWSAVLSLF